MHPQQDRSDPLSAAEQRKLEGHGLLGRLVRFAFERPRAATLSAAAALGALIFWRR